MLSFSPQHKLFGLPRVPAVFAIICPTFYIFLIDKSLFLAAELRKATSFSLFFLKQQESHTVVAFPAVEHTPTKDRNDSNTSPPLKVSCLVCVQWVEEGKSVWAIARVARNTCNLKTRYTKIEDEEGQVHTEDSDIAAAFIKHNLITEENETTMMPEEEEEEVQEEGSERHGNEKGTKANR